MINLQTRIWPCPRCGGPRKRTKAGKYRGTLYCPSCLKKYYQKNKEAQKIRSKVWEKENPGFRLNYNLNNNYNLSKNAFEDLLRVQKHACAICKQAETTKDRWGNVLRLSVDHNHETGKIRGLLCAACNHAIGFVKENVKTLKQAAEYLEQYI